jgi:hypothetical protein
MPSFTPLNWKQYNLSDVNQMRRFQLELSDWANAINTANQLSNILNGSSLLLASSFASKVTDLGAISSDQTVAAGGAEFVSVRLSNALTQTRTLTFSSLSQSAILLVNVAGTANTLTLKMAATDPNGNSYTINAWNTTNAVITNMVSTGLALGVTTYIFFGMSGFVGTSSTPNLSLLFV